jgi:hypothetical protein
MVLGRINLDSNGIIGRLWLWRVGGAARGVAGIKSRAKRDEALWQIEREREREREREGERERGREKCVAIKR